MRTKVKTATPKMKKISIANVIASSEETMQVYLKWALECPRPGELRQCKGKRVMTAIPSHAICVATYARYEVDPTEVCRITAVVTRLDTDEIVERIEAWIREEEDIVQAFERVAELELKYEIEATEVFWPVELIPRLPAPNGGEYVDLVITRNDWLAAHKVKRKPARSRR